MMRRGGFTLVEILVVICIVTVLVAITSPVILRARRQARIAQGWAMMRQTVAAIQIYRVDHNDMLPSRDAAAGVVPQGVQCHPLDQWTPFCSIRKARYMIGSWGYAPADEPDFDMADGCLLVNVFADEGVLTPVYDHHLSLDELCIAEETCLMPARLEFMNMDGALKVKRMNVRPRFTAGPFTLFGWGHAFDLCRAAYR